MTRALSASSSVVAGSDQVFSNLEDEVAILSLKDGMYYGLNEVGARIWNLIQEPRTVGEVRDLLVSEYEVNPDRCEHELIALLQDLVAEGIVEVRT